MGQIKHLDEVYDEAYIVMEQAIRDASTVISDPKETAADLESLVVNRVTKGRIALAWERHTLIEMVSHIQFKQKVQSLLALGGSKATHEARAAAVRLVDSQRGDLSDAAKERIGRREKMSAEHEERGAKMRIDHDRWGAQGGSRDTAAVNAYAAAVNAYPDNVKAEAGRARDNEAENQTQQEEVRRLARQSVLDSLSNRNRSVASAAAATVAAGRAGSLTGRNATESPTSSTSTHTPRQSLIGRFASRVRSARRGM